MMVLIWVKDVMPVIWRTTVLNPYLDKGMSWQMNQMWNC